jgi:hypothetical protein
MLNDMLQTQSDQMLEVVMNKEMQHTLRSERAAASKKMRWQSIEECAAQR